MKQLKTGFLVAVLLLGVVVNLHAQTTAPIGTAIIVTLNQSVSSKDAKTGQTVSGVVSDNVVVNGQTVIPKNSSVTMTVYSVQPSGRLSTPAQLWLRIQSIQVKGKTYTVSSNSSGQKGTSHNKRNVVAIGGGTAAGAVIGGLAGGGKGAAIGAGVGAAAGTAGAALTGKKDITYPAETKLRFTLKQSLTIQ